MHFDSTGSRRSRGASRSPARTVRRALMVGLCLVTSVVALHLRTSTASAPAAAPGSHSEHHSLGPGAEGGVFHSGARVDSLIRPGEVRFRNLVQLTNGGENAEAYFSWDGRELILQATPRGGGCDQIYVMPAAGGPMRLVSTGRGRCTCAYFFPGDEEILFSSTHLAGDECPPPPDHSTGYVWALFPGYDIFKAKRDGKGLVRLTHRVGYDAEATVGPDGTIVFTSDRDGDLEIYRMAADGSDVRRLTFTPGYDGGAFFSADGTKICYRARHPEDPEELEEYRRLLAQGLIRPGKLDIWVMDADGGNQVRLTRNDAANFGPFFHPSGERVIFSSNLEDTRSRNFDLYMIDLDGENLERITFEPTFDGFPMFSPDGTRLVFSSNRNAEIPGETNVFVAEWIESPERADERAPYPAGSDRE